MANPLDRSFYDTATDANTTLVTTHVPEIGTWAASPPSNVSANVAIDTNRIRCNSATFNDIKMSAATSPSFELSFRVRRLGALPNNAVGPVFRQNVAGDEMYQLLMNGSAQWNFWRTGSVVTAYADPSFDVNDEREVRVLVMDRGASAIVTGFFDGVGEIFYTDNSPYAGTIAGWRFIDAPNIAFDNISLRNYPTTQTATAGVTIDATYCLSIRTTDGTLASDGAAPFTFQGYKTISAGDWTAYDVGYPGIYQATLSPAAPKACIQEDGKPMGWHEGADIEAVRDLMVAGDFHVSTDGTTAYVYATTGNPATNGSVYRHSRVYTQYSAEALINLGAPGASLSNFIVEGSMTVNNATSTADNGYGVGDDSGATGDITISNGTINYYGKHGIGIVYPRSDSHIQITDVSVDKGSPYCLPGDQTPYVVYMESGAGSGNTVTLTRCSTTYRTALIGSTGGVVEPAGTDFLTHGTGGVGQEFDLISIVDCRFAGLITQNDPNATLFKVSGTTYGGYSFAGEYIINGILSRTAATATTITLAWTNADSSADDCTAQLQRSLAGADDWDDVASGTTSPKVDTVTPGVLYDYRVEFTDGVTTVYSNTLEGLSAATAANLSEGILGVGAFGRLSRGLI